MNARIKKGLKATGKYLLIAAAAALLSGFLFYLTKGWPISMGLKERARRGKLVSVEVTRQGETATLTGEEDLLLASGTAEILTVFLPGSPSEEKPETEYTFTFSDGTQTRVGATEAAVFRD